MPNLFLQPVAGAGDAVLDVQQLADNGADHQRQDGDQLVAAADGAGDADADGYQTRGGQHGLLHLFGHEPAAQCAQNAAGCNSGGVDQYTGEYHGTSPPSLIISRTTVPPIIRPATEGTHATLAGTLRRPGDGASSCCVSWGSSGLNTTFRWWIPRRAAPSA